jgi:hypothetical protein
MKEGKELHKCQYAVRIIGSWRIRLADHAECMTDFINANKYLAEAEWYI